MYSSIFFKGDVSHFIYRAFKSGSLEESPEVVAEVKNSVQPAYADCSAIVKRAFTERAKILNGLHRGFPIPIIIGELFVLKTYAEMYLLLNRYIMLHNQLESEGCKVTFTRIMGQNTKKNGMTISEHLISTPKGLLIFLRMSDFWNRGCSDYITSGLKEFLEQYNKDDSTPESRLARALLAFYELDMLTTEMATKTYAVYQTIPEMNNWQNMETLESIVPLKLLPSRDLKPKRKITSAILQNLVPGIFHSYQTLIPMLSSFLGDSYYIYSPEMKAYFPKVCIQLRALVTNDYFKRQMSLLQFVTKAGGGEVWTYEQKKYHATISAINYPQHYEALSELILTLPSFSSLHPYDITELRISGAKASKNIQKRGKIRKVKDRRFNPPIPSPSSSPSSSSSFHLATHSSSSTSIPSSSYEIVEDAIPATSSSSSSSTSFTNLSFSLPVPSKIEEEVNPQVLCSSPLFQEAITPQKKLIMTHRVWRWMRCSPEKWEDILCFEDKGMRNYGDCSKEEALFQLGLHGFSPLMDRLIMSKLLRERFALKTSTGWAVLVDFVYEDGTVVRGLIGWAFCPRSKQCYHRFLERVNNLDILNRKLQDMAEEFTQLPDPEMLSQEITVTEESLEIFNDGFIGDEVNFDVKTNIFTVMDRKNRIKISAYPLRF